MGSCNHGFYNFTIWQGKEGEPPVPLLMPSKFLLFNKYSNFMHEKLLNKGKNAFCFSKHPFSHPFSPFNLHGGDNNDRQDMQSSSLINVMVNDIEFNNTKYNHLIIHTKNQLDAFIRLSIPRSKPISIGRYKSDPYYHFHSPLLNSSNLITLNIFEELKEEKEEEEMNTLDFLLPSLKNTSDGNENCILFIGGMDQASKYCDWILDKKRMINAFNAQCIEYILAITPSNLIMSLGFDGFILEDNKWIDPNICLAMLIPHSSLKINKNESRYEKNDREDIEKGPFIITRSMDNMLTDYHGELNIEELLTNSDVDAHVQLFDDNDSDDRDSKEMFRILANRGRMMALDIGHGKLKEGTKFKIRIMKKKKQDQNREIKEEDKRIDNDDTHNNCELVVIKQLDSENDYYYYHSHKETKNTTTKVNDSSDLIQMTNGRVMIECANLMYGKIDRPKSFCFPMSISINNL